MILLSSSLFGIIANRFKRPVQASAPIRSDGFRQKLDLLSYFRSRTISIFNGDTALAEIAFTILLRIFFVVTIVVVALFVLFGNFNNLPSPFRSERENFARLLRAEHDA